VWINTSDIILVGLRDYQDNKADVILKYNADEARSLKAYGELPEHAKINETDTFGPGDDDEIQFDDIGDDDEDIDDQFYSYRATVMWLLWVGSRQRELISRFNRREVYSIPIAADCSGFDVLILSEVLLLRQYSPAAQEKFIFTLFKVFIFLQ
ncbi:hypothetical protein AB205_0139080, partial [Aquarana catesbeiana]